MGPLTSSLLVPFYNEAKYLPNLLESILRQTLPLPQIVLCNNGSTDSSLTVIKPYITALPLKIVSEATPGIIPSLQTALKHAAGNLILKTDADCILPPHWHENIQLYFSEHPGLHALTGPWYASDGHIIHRLLLSTAGSLGAAILATFQGYPLLQGCNYAVKSQAILAIHGYENSGNLPTDDQLLTYKLHRAHFKIGWSWSNYLFTSTRRYQHHPGEYFSSLRSLISPRFYKLHRPSQ